MIGVFLLQKRRSDIGVTATEVMDMSVSTQANNNRVFNLKQALLSRIHTSVSTETLFTHSFN